MNVSHQESRPENFAYVYNGVHFLGLHVLFQSFHGDPELNKIVLGDVDWLNSEFSAMQEPNVGAIVMFGHSFPNDTMFLPFNELLEMMVQSINKLFIFIQGDLHVFMVGNPFPSNDIFFC